jgi:hypothetical protein
MPDEPDKPIPRRRTITVSTAVVAWIISGLGVGYLLWTSAAGPLPYPELHDVVTTTLGVGTVLAWLWHVATDGSNRRRRDIEAAVSRVETLFAEGEAHRATAHSCLHAAVVEGLANRNDIPTDRILTVVAEATTQVREELAHLRNTFDSRLVVVEVAMSSKLEELRRSSYSAGYVTGVKKRLAAAGDDHPN